MKMCTKCTKDGTPQALCAIDNQQSNAHSNQNTNTHLMCRRTGHVHVLHRHHVLRWHHRHMVTPNTAAAGPSCHQVRLQWVLLNRGGGGGGSG
jgi:hypothetical protein